VIRPILTYPGDVDRLRRLTVSVGPITDVVRRLIVDLGETMGSADGVGIAAPQVGVPSRLFLIDGAVASPRSGVAYVVFINPVIVERSVEVAVDREGCLSFPGVFVHVPRARRCVVHATDLRGSPFTVEADGFYARALQHEADHLFGVLLIDAGAKGSDRL